jgi:hypothetical protein
MIFSAIGFPPGGSGRYTCTITGKRQIYRKREKIPKHRIYKIENKYIKTRKQS